MGFRAKGTVKLEADATATSIVLKVTISLHRPMP
jgi:hypothetical protein